MAAREARDREPGTREYAALANRNERVLRAGRIKAASRRKQRRKKELVEPDQSDEQ
jgi:hypothetical protein